ncbi:mucin-13 isoform X2 [Castor canadensis]|uniref:Mucin-13 isoform X2 n=1 Tax=Castor canadensis TaxID=51338 RepID=A0AC58MJ76_CASCN
MKAFVLLPLLTLPLVNLATTSTLGSPTSTSPISDTSTVSTSSPMPSSTIDTTESSTSNSPSTGSTPSVSATQNTSATPFTTTLGYSTSSETNTPNTGTTGSSTLCQADTCGSSASCFNLHTEHICLCAEGYYYTDRTCNRGKTFPGDISVLVSETTDLKNETSRNYQDLHTKVTKFFADAFSSTDYYQTVILKVSIPSSRSASSEVRASDETVTVSVVNIFAQNTSQSETNISKIIEDAIKQNVKFSAYSGQDRCDYYGCVKNADGCSNGLDCDCKAGLQRPNVQSPFCLALECPEECNAEHKKQCLKEDSQTLKCICLPGYQTDDQGNCKECPFGYSGVDCKDQFKLILTIVGTIAGILILSLVITLIFSTRSRNKKNTEEQKLIENDYQNLQLQQTGFINLGASGASNGNLFPKVRTSTPRNTPAQNPYANQRGVPHPDY